MDQSLLIAILVGLVVVLLGVLLLLVVAMGGVWLWSRRAQKARPGRRRSATRRADAPRDVASARPPVDPTTPTPIRRIAAAPPTDPFGANDPFGADEAATEVMSERHVRAFFDQDDTTGATDVNRVVHDDSYNLEEVDETTEVGPIADGS